MSMSRKSTLPIDWQVGYHIDDGGAGEQGGLVSRADCLPSALPLLNYFCA